MKLRGGFKPSSIAFAQVNKRENRNAKNGFASGAYAGGLNVVKSEEGTALNISGGTFTRTAAPRWGITGTVLVYGATTITGGTFNEKSTSPSARVVVTGKVDGYDSVTYIKGGTFVGFDPSASPREKVRATWLPAMLLLTTPMAPTALSLPVAHT